MNNIGIRRYIHAYYVARTSYEKISELPEKDKNNGYLVHLNLEFNDLLFPKIQF